MGRIICVIDIETSGLDKTIDSITEIAWLIKDTDVEKPLLMRTYFVRPEDLGSFVILDDCYELTKITKVHLALGETIQVITERLYHDVIQFGVDAMCAHNGEYFDKPFILEQMFKHGCTPSHRTALKDILWIDTLTDCVYPKTCKGLNLTYICAFYGFINPFPHAALSDAWSTMRVLGYHPIDEVMERARSPWVIIQANVTYDQRSLAKERRYFWERLNGVDTVFTKQWVKRVRRIDMEKEMTDVPFAVFEREYR